MLPEKGTCWVVGCRGRLLTSTLKPAESPSAPRHRLTLPASMWQLLPPAVLLLLGKSAAAERDTQDAWAQAPTDPSHLEGRQPGLSS